MIGFKFFDVVPESIERSVGELIDAHRLKSIDQVKVVVFEPKGKEGRCKFEVFYKIPEQPDGP